MLQAIIKRGKVIPEEVTCPSVMDGTVLIRVINSCISPGTELHSVKTSGISILSKIIEEPKKIQKVISKIKNDGLKNTLFNIKEQLEKYSFTGYSAAGIVIDIGKNVNNFRKGDFVAAAGAGYANHAEIINVPENLVIKIPKELDFKKASTVALGGIALQGIRRADLRIGEFCAVVGCGVIGLITLQILNISGIRTIAIDICEERLNIAKELGANYIINPINEDQIKIVSSITNGYGVDAVIFTAATDSSEPLSLSFHLCKRKGKVVLVGVSGMNIKRSDIYLKELDFLISTSYGPGRYDKNYEEKGLDYPYSYVRWTENRNMAEYLRLISEEKVKLDKMISAIYPIEKVTEAFELISSTKNKPLLVILDYNYNYENKNLSLIDKTINKVTSNIKFKKANDSIIKVALIGAGSFAKSIHLPNIIKLKNKYSLHAIVDIDGYNAKSTASIYNAKYATTNIDDILSDNEINLVMITTRHDTHANYVLKSLNAGKNVFVEKPLAINKEELDSICAFYENNLESNKPLLMVGFNRRFSEYAKEILKHTSKRINPLFINYTINAGYIPSNHWVHESGGRIIGEACHIIDLMTFFTESKIQSICVDSFSPRTSKFSFSDNKSFILKYSDGSICSINYFSIGSKEYSKEKMEIHFDEKSIILDDYKYLQGYGVNIQNINSKVSKKGHYEELLILYDALQNGNSWPIELWDMVQTTQVSFIINEG